MRNMTIKLMNKFRLQMVGVVVALTAIALALALWSTNDSQKAKTEVSEKEKRAKVVQAYRDKKGRILAQPKASAERSDSKQTPGIPEAKPLTERGKPFNVTTPPTTQNITSRSKGNDTVLSSTDEVIRQLIAKKMGTDFLKNQPRTLQVTEVLKGLQPESTQESSLLSQSGYSPSGNQYTSYRTSSSQNENSARQGPILGTSRKTSGGSTLRISGSRNISVALATPTHIDIQPPQMSGQKADAVRIKNSESIEIPDANGLKVYKPQQIKK